MTCRFEVRWRVLVLEPWGSGDFYLTETREYRSRANARSAQASLAKKHPGKAVLLQVAYLEWQYEGAQSTEETADAWVDKANAGIRQHQWFRKEDVAEAMAAQSRQEKIPRST